MATVGSLVVELSANVARLQRDLGRAVAISERRARQVQKAWKTATRGIGAAMAAAGGTRMFARALQEASEYQRQMLKLNGVLRATGYTAGLTAREIDQFARSLGEATLASERDVRDAAAALATFRTISGERFKQTLRLSQDLAALGFGTLRSAAIQLGKALEDPATGLTQLRRVGVSFTQEQQDLIKSLARTGDVARAQGEILRILQQQVGGAGTAEGQGMAGAVDLLDQRWRELLEALGRTSPMRTAIKWIESLTESVENFRKAVVPTDIERFIQLQDTIGQLQNRLATMERGRAKNALARQLLEAKSEFRKLAPVIEKMWEAEQRRKKLAEETARRMEMQTRATREAEERLKRMEDRAKKVQAVIDRLFPNQARARQFAEELQLLSEKFGENSEQVRRLQKEFAKATGGPRKLVHSLKQSSKEVSDFARDMGWAFQSSFEDAILSAERFSNVLRSLGRQVAGIVLRETVTEPFGKFVAGMVGSILPKFATGTSFAPGGMALVGERGPELVNLPRGSKVIPSGKLSNILNGGQSTGLIITQNFYLNGVNLEAATLLKLEAKAIERNTIAAFREMKLRGRLPEFL